MKGQSDYSTFASAGTCLLLCACAGAGSWLFHGIWRSPGPRVDIPNMFVLWPGLRVGDSSSVNLEATTDQATVLPLHPRNQLMWRHRELQGLIDPSGPSTGRGGKSRSGLAGLELLEQG